MVGSLRKTMTRTFGNDRTVRAMARGMQWGGAAGGLLGAGAVVFDQTQQRRDANASLGSSALKGGVIGVLAGGASKGAAIKMIAGGLVGAAGSYYTGGSASQGMGLGMLGGGVLGLRGNRYGKIARDALNDASDFYKSNPKLAKKIGKFTKPLVNAYDTLRTRGVDGLVLDNRVAQAEKALANVSYEGMGPTSDAFNTAQRRLTKAIYTRERKSIQNQVRSMSAAQLQEALGGLGIEGVQRRGRAEMRAATGSRFRLRGETDREFIDRVRPSAERLLKRQALLNADATSLAARGKAARALNSPELGLNSPRSQWLEGRSLFNSGVIPELTHRIRTPVRSTPVQNAVSPMGARLTGFQNRGYRPRGVPGDNRVKPENASLIYPTRV
jgi:hypothetical protein